MPYFYWMPVIERCFPNASLSNSNIYRSLAAIRTDTDTDFVHTDDGQWNYIYYTDYVGADNLTL